MNIIPTRLISRMFTGTSNIPTILQASIIVAGVLFSTVQTATAGDVWSASVTVNTKPAEAGKLAGQQLKEACAGRKPDLVLLFDFRSVIRTPEDKKAILQGLSESFDRNSIYGATMHGRSQNSSSKGSVGALALGGIEATPVKVALEQGKEKTGYATLAESLNAPYAAAKDKGRLVLIFGECVPRTNNEKIVSAFISALGKDVQLFGSPSPIEPFAYFQGELLTNTLMAILITGDFTCSFAMADASPVKTGDQHQEPDKIVDSADKAMKSAVGDKKDSAALIFITSSFTRDHSLGNMRDKRPTGAADEDRAIRGGIKAPLLIIGDDLEIGHPATGEPAAAKEDQINVCVINSKK